MKKIVLFLVIIFFSLSIFHGASAEIALPFPVEAITSFNAEITIQKNSTIVVSETIEYDFGSLQKHGIIRSIPNNFQRKKFGAYATPIKVVSIRDENQKSVPFTADNYAENFEIKIGDANTLITGKKTYHLIYEIKDIINYFEDHDELYWNVIGNDWMVAINKASAQIIFPEKIKNNDLKTACYTGVFGSTDSECLFEISQTENNTKILLTSYKYFGAGEGMSFVLSFPKKIIYEPGPGKIFINFIKDNWQLTIPFIAFIVMFILWYKKGREPKGRGVVVAEYEAPQKLSALEIGTIVDQRVEKNDISSLIIDLAVRGYLKIKYISDSDYEFVKLKDASSLSKEYEKVFLNGLFGKKKTMKLSEVGNGFYQISKDVEKLIYEEVTRKNYFVKNPRTVRWMYRGIGISIMVLGFFAAGTDQNMSLIYFLSFCLGGGIVILFGKIMPRYTNEGIKIREQILGFKLFLSVTEKERLKFHNAPAKKPELFEKFLPFAIALKVEKEWAKQFEGIYTKAPSWYDGNYRTFNVLIFANSLHSFSSTAGNTFVPHTYARPVGTSGFSSGGGFSGGGFGGGGGGSW